MNRNVIWGLIGGATAIVAGAAALAAPPPGNPVKGKAVFARCAVCHRIDPAVAGGIGPNLAGVYGRPAGQRAGYAYSPAMRAAHIKWDEATLSRFLVGPGKMVPGTKMMATPVTDAQDRADVIAFLKTVGGGAK